MSQSVALVVGYGSIGARHARLLQGIGCRVAVVSARTVDFPTAYTSLSDAVAQENPSYVVIANATSRHYDTLMQLAEIGYQGQVLVEKPLFDKTRRLEPLPFSNTFVAYNLRFHPVIQRLNELLKGESIISVQAYVGQYLPEWRPASDYRNSYSANAEQGGGVLRDLSHELDYLQWIFGDWKRVCALGGHLSPLEITSDDVFSLMLVTERCPVMTLQMNYLDRMTRRSILVNTANHTISADLISGVVTVDREGETFVLERDYTYRAMHEALLAGSWETLCTLESGVDTMRLIEAAETAANKGEWVKQ